jgi:hypothetical protein
VGSPSEELGAIVTRLEEAAERLKADATPPSDPSPPEPAEPRAQRVAPVERRRLGEVLEGLERANVEVRRARARLAELEARLGLDRAA